MRLNSKGAVTQKSGKLSRTVVFLLSFCLILSSFATARIGFAEESAADEKTAEELIGDTASQGNVPKGAAVKEKDTVSEEQAAGEAEFTADEAAGTRIEAESGQPQAIEPPMAVQTSAGAELKEPAARALGEPVLSPEAEVLSEGEAGDNLLLNPGFENGLDNWTPVITTPATISVSFDNAVKYDGDQSLKIVLGGDGYRGTYDQICPAEEKETYKLSGFIKTEAGDGKTIGEISIQIYCYDSGGSYLGAEGFTQYQLKNTGTTGWTKYETPEITAPTGTASIHVRFNALNGSGTVWLDNLALTKRAEEGEPGTLSFITVAPGKAALNVGETTTLNVKGFDGEGNPIDLSQADITYVSSAPYIISVTKNGIVSAESKGTASVTVNVSLNGINVSKSAGFTISGENDVVKYDFKQPISSIANGAAWEIKSTDVTGANGVRSQVYGIQVQSKKGQYITFNIVAPETGYYTAFFKGSGYSGGGIADIYLDDVSSPGDGMFIGQYNFFGPGGEKPQELLKSLYLDAGVHTLTFKAVARPSDPGAWGENMYITEFLLAPKSSLPTLEAVEAYADKSDIAVGQTARISAQGVMSNGYIDLLRNDDAVVEYESSAEDVASVDADGAVRALKPGNVTIAVKVTINGITKEAAVPMTVNNKKLETVEVLLEKNEIPKGSVTKAAVTAKYTDGSLIDLKEAVVEFSSSNPGAATVDNNGTVTAVAKGSADITAKVTFGGISATGRAAISVVDLMLDTVAVQTDKTRLFVGRRATLTVTGKMNDASDADLSKAAITCKTYEVVDGNPAENDDLAEISVENGIVTVAAKKPGILEIVVEVGLDGVIKTADGVMITIESTEGITSSKTKRTYYTDEKIAAAHENIEKYDWAKAMRDAAVETADAYVDKAETLWNMVPSQSIPRSITVNPQYTCPSCGQDLRAKYGNYPWLLDPINDPWKLTCPSCGVKFPTNNFESYYKGGLDSHGIFDPELAKRHNDELIANGGKGNLVNVLYPEKGETWGVDDGYGWIDGNNVRQTFIAYYAHWGLWYVGTIQKALDSLKDAYIYTGDKKYAYTGTILLDRIADVYPDMDLSVYKDADGYRNSHGGTGEGKVVGCIWETGLVNVYIKAYDAFFPAMDDEEIINFLKEKSEALDQDNPKSSGALIRKNIEDGILRQVYTGVKAAKIRGNFGMHQASLALAAVVLDSNPETKEWLDFDFQAGALLSNPWRVTGGDIMATLVDRVDRDGNGNEAAPEYNKLWLGQILQVADVLDGYEGYPGADLYKNPKFKKMFSAFYPLILAERYTAQIGDSGSTGNPGITASIEQSVDGFIKFGDPVLAQLAYFLNKNSVDGLHGDIFTRDPENVGPEIQSVIDERGKLDLTSDNLAGYGFTVLRDGENGKQYFGYQIPFPTLTPFDATAAFKYFEASGTIQFEAESPGQSISFKFDVPKTDTYEIDLNPFKAATYGIYDIKIDGVKVKTVDFYGGSGASSNLEVLATMELTEGEHVITFEGTGKNESANNYKMGVIHIILFDEEALAIKNDDTLTDTQRDLWMYYGRNTGHGHKDTLNLGVHAYGLDIAPDLGYPEETGEQPNRVEWVSNTVSHNTVVVDKSKQSDVYVGTPVHFDDSEMVDVFDVDAKEAYPQTEMYRRTVAMVKVDDEISYGIDFFRIKGGNDHNYSFHGYEGPVIAEGLNLTPQKDENGNFVGSYAGPDVEYGVRPAGDSGTGWDYKGAGFHWLKNVEKDTSPGNKFSIDWDITDGRKVLPEEMDIHLRLTMLGEYDDVAIMDGVPPKIPGNPASLKYMIAHRSGENLNSTFTAVIEPYKDTRYIESIDEVQVTVNGEPAPEGVKAVKVVLRNERTDYIVNSLDTGTVYTVKDGDVSFSFKGFLGVCSVKGGKQIYGYVNDGTMIGNYSYDSPAAAEGTVKGFTKDLNVDNELTVEFTNEADVNGLPGRYIYIANDGVQNAAYRINGIKSVNGNEATLDLGATTLIRSYVDPSDLSRGYVYNISEGDSFVIPLSYEAGTPSVPETDIVFARENISLKGSSKITGDVGTNAVEAGSVDFAWSAGIDGDLLIGPEGDWTKVVNSARPDPKENVRGEIAPLPSVREYPLPKFPEFPDLEDKGDLTAGWKSDVPCVIEKSGSYGNIDVTNKLTVNVGEEDIKIVADNLSVTGSGRILINRTGGGRLILYVADRLELANSGKINPEGSPEDVFLYYAGDEALNFGGSTSVNGSLFAEKADVVLTGSGGITGHIVTGGNTVNLSGNAQADAGVIYAPQATLTVSGSGGIRGAVIVRSLELSGSALIQYDDSMDPGFFEQLDW